MSKGKEPTRWGRAFPPAWRDRYGSELSALLEDLREQDDLRPSDRIDLVKRGLAMRRHGLERRRSVYGALGVVAATVCALVGLVLAGTFTSQITSAPSASPRILELHIRHIIELHTYGVPVPAKRVLTACHVTARTGKVQCPKVITSITVTVCRVTTPTDKVECPDHIDRSHG